jgi:hypothetical protein
LRRHTGDGILIVFDHQGGRMNGDRQAGVAVDPVIRHLAQQVDGVLVDFHDLCDWLTPKQLNWRPTGKRWSIAQCLEHTSLTAMLYPQEIERMIGEARAREAAGAGPYREGLLARKVVSGMEPPPRMRVPTVRKVTPPADLDRSLVMASFEASHRLLRDLILLCDGVPLGHARMRSPFVPLIRFTLGQALHLNAAHARRHLWQARQVRAEAGFPA